MIYTLFVTGGDRDGWRIFDYELHDEIAATLEDWATDDHLDEFGYGNGEHSCEAHPEESGDGCIDCLNEETQAAKEKIEKWAEGRATFIADELLREGRSGTELSGSSITFRLHKEA